MANDLEQLYSNTVGQQDNEQKQPLEDLYNQSTSQNKQQGFVSVNENVQTEKKLDINFLEEFSLRGKLAFGDEKGRENFLKNRFPNRKINKLPTGKFEVDGIPIDPEGFRFDDLLFDTTVDIADELVRLGGQIYGATKGAAIGAGTALIAGQAGPQAALPEELVTMPAGAIIGGIKGGALGRATGQTAVEAIGRAFGLRKDEAIEAVKNIAFAGAEGAAGEALGYGIQGVTKAGGKLVKNIYNTLSKKIGKPATSKLLNFTSGLDEVYIKRLQDKGVNAVMTPKNVSDDSLLMLGKRIQKSAAKVRGQLGKAVEKGKISIRGMDKANIAVDDIMGNVIKKMQSSGMIDDTLKPIGREVRNFTTDEKKLFKVVENITKKKKMSPKQILRVREDLDVLLEGSFDKLGRRTISSTQENLLKSIRGGLKEKLIKASPEFAKANQQFSSFSLIDDALQGKLKEESVEGFLDKFVTGKQYGQNWLRELEMFLPAGEKFTEELLNVLTARAFSKSTFQGIRTGIISGIFGGLGFATGGPLGTVAATGTGIALSTPKAAAKAIGLKQAGNRIMQKLMIRVSRQMNKGKGIVGVEILKELMNKR